MKTIHALIFAICTLPMGIANSYSSDYRAFINGTDVWLTEEDNKFGAHYRDVEFTSFCMHSVVKAESHLNVTRDTPRHYTIQKSSSSDKQASEKVLCAVIEHIKKQQQDVQKTGWFPYKNNQFNLTFKESTTQGEGDVKKFFDHVTICRRLGAHLQVTENPQTQQLIASGYFEIPRNQEKNMQNKLGISDEEMHFLLRTNV